MAQYRVNFSNLGRLSWQAKLGIFALAAVGIAGAIALVVVSVGLAIILLPVVAIGLVIGRWRLRKMMADAVKARPADPRTIEIDYTVVDRDRR